MAIQILNLSDRDATASRPDLRRSLGRFATGVTIVTMRNGSAVHGLTVNAFSSVSLDPPLVLIVIDKQARGHRLLQGRPFAVNVLGADHETLARHFAGQRVDGVMPRWIHGLVAPRLRGALAYVECVPGAQFDGGDHTVFLGEVVGHGYSTARDPLIFMDGHFAVVPFQTRRR